MQDNIGLTLAKVVFGRVIRVACELVFGTPENGAKQVEDYVDDLKDKILGIHNIPREWIAIVTDRMTIWYDIRAISLRLQGRDKIWLKCYHQS